MSASGLVKSFGASSGAKRPAPFSIRFSAEERALLERRAGRQALGSYIRAVLLDGKDVQRMPPAPKIDYALLGQVLAKLGKSELSSSLCLLAAAAEHGALPVDEELESDLRAACAHIRAMRAMLIVALGVKERP